MFAQVKPSPPCACYNRHDWSRSSFLRTIARLFCRFLHCELKIAPGGAKRIRRKNDDLSRAEASGCSVRMTIRGTNDAEKNVGGGVERRLIGPGAGGGCRSPQCADHSGGRHIDVENIGCTDALFLRKGGLHSHFIQHLELVPMGIVWRHTEDGERSLLQ